ncbi:MAG: CvpA family protein [Ignavibacteria bacterium]
MNALDIIILILVLLPAFFGLKKGLIKSILSYVSIIAGIILALKFNSGFVLVLRPIIKDPKLVQVVIFVGIILSIYLIAILIGSKISKMNVLSETFDKTGGFIFGGLKGLLFTSILLIIFDSFSFIPNNQKSSSHTFSYTVKAAPATYNIIKDILPFSKKDFYDIINYGDSDSVKVKTQ